METHVGFVSGSGGFALVPTAEEGEYLVFEAESEAEYRVPRRHAGALLRLTPEYEQVHVDGLAAEDVVARIRERLREAWSRHVTLKLLWITIDERYSTQLRRKSAHALSTRFDDSEVYDWVQQLVLSQPCPIESLCHVENASQRVQELVGKLRALQPGYERAAWLWRVVALQSGMSAQGRDALWSGLIRVGALKELFSRSWDAEAERRELVALTICESTLPVQVDEEQAIQLLDAFFSAFRSRDAEAAIIVHWEEAARWVLDRILVALGEDEIDHMGVWLALALQTPEDARSRFELAKQRDRERYARRYRLLRRLGITHDRFTVCLSEDGVALEYQRVRRRSLLGRWQKTATNKVFQISWREVEILLSFEDCWGSSYWRTREISSKGPFEYTLDATETSRLARLRHFRGDVETSALESWLLGEKSTTSVLTRLFMKRKIRATEEGTRAFGELVAKTVSSDDR